VTMPFPSPTVPASGRTEVFLRYLNYFRDSVMAKVSALADEELRGSRLPSGRTPLLPLRATGHGAGQLLSGQVGLGEVAEAAATVEILHGLQAGGFPPGRPGRDQNAFPSARVQ